GGLETRAVRLYRLAGRILQQRVADVVLQRIGVFDVADRVPDLLDVGRDALVALAADTDRPLDRGAFADGILPFRADLGQVVGEVERRARSIRAVHDGDLRVRQREVAVQGSYGRLVPVRDLAEADVREHVAIQTQGAGFDAFDVEHRHDAADDERDLAETVLVEFLPGQ